MPLEGICPKCNAITFISSNDLENGFKCYRCDIILVTRGKFNELNKETKKEPCHYCRSRKNPQIPVCLSCIQDMFNSISVDPSENP